MVLNIENINGMWVISALIDGYLITEKYAFFTKREAIKLFKMKYRKRN